MIQLKLLPKESGPKYYYLFTNNITIRSYLSLDALVCDGAIGTDNIEISQSSYHPAGFFIGLDPLAYQGLILNSSNETLYPICVELEFSEETQTACPALLIKFDDQIEEGSLADFDPNVHKQAWVFGYIPFSFVRGIHFRSEEECRRLDFEMRNICYPYDLFFVSPELFDGTIRLELQALAEKIDAKLSEKGIKTSDLFADIEKRNRIKAIVLAVLAKSRGYVSRYSLNLDPGVFKLVRTASDFNIDGFKEFLEGTYGKFGSQRILEYLNQENKASLLHQLDAVLSCVDKPYIQACSKLKELVIPEVYQEACLFLLALQMLIRTKRMVHFDAHAFLTNLAAKSREFDQGDYYFRRIEFIKNAILTDKKRISDVLTAKADGSQQTSAMLRALMLFVKTPHFSDYSALEKNLESFDLAPDEHSLVWILYSALNGVGVFSREIKSNPLLNRYCDQIALYFTRHSELINQAASSDAFLGYRSYKENIAEVSCYPLAITESEAEDAEVSRNLQYKLLKFINKNMYKNRKLLAEAIDRIIDINNELYKPYWLYKHFIPHDYLIEIKDNYLLTKTPELTVELALDCNEFYDDVLTNDDRFYSFYKLSPKAWHKLEEELFRD